MWPFKKAPAVAAAGEVAVGNFTLTAQLAGASGRTMNVAGYIYLGDDEKALNERLDMYQKVIERQRIRCEIPELEARREQHVQALKNAKDVISELEEKQRNGHLTSQEKMNLQNHKTAIKRMNEEIDKGAAAIQEAKRKAGVG